MSESQENPEQTTTNPRMPGWRSVVAATSFGVFLSALDGSIVNVSLATMEASLVATKAEIQWVVIAYLLVMTSAMPLMGKFGDRFGKTKVFQTGMLLFITGSLFCAFSSALELLVASRVFQAIGSSMISANGLALVTYYTTPRNRGRAIGLNSIVLAGALALGPVLGGILSQYFGWPSIFLINLPVGLIGVLVVAKLIPETEKVFETEFDTVGAALFFSFLFSVIYTVSVLDSLTFTSLAVLLPVIVGSLIGFIFRERGFSSPIIPVGVLADRRISASVFSALFSYM
ncbi:MAG: MFS transporter, partial [Candidatus Hodarchaeota archaeon]